MVVLDLPATTRVDLAVDRYEGFVFDMDGVITDTATVHSAAWAETFDAYLRQRSSHSGEHHRPFSHDDYLRFVDGRHREDGVRAFLDSRGISLPTGEIHDPPGWETIWGISNRKNLEFNRLVAERGVRAFPSSVAFAVRLQKMRIAFALVTASRNCEVVLAAAGLTELFAVRVDGVDAESLGLQGKPAPDVFLEAARRLGIGPGGAVAVEDAVAGVQAARAAGFGLVVGIDRWGDGSALRTGGADLVVADLAQLHLRGRPG